MESRVVYQQNKRRKKKLRFRKWVIVVFLIFFLSIFSFSAYKVYSWYNDNKEVDNISDDVLKNTKVKEKKIIIIQKMLIHQKIFLMIIGII